MGGQQEGQVAPVGCAGNTCEDVRGMAAHPVSTVKPTPYTEHVTVHAQNSVRITCIICPCDVRLRSDCPFKSSTAHHSTIPTTTNRWLQPTGLQSFPRVFCRQPRWCYDSLVVVTTNPGEYQSLPINPQRYP